MASALCRRCLNKYTVYYRQRQLCDRFWMILSVVQVSCQVYSYWDGQELASSVLNSSSSYWVGIRYTSVGKIRYSNIIQFYLMIKMFIRFCGDIALAVNSTECCVSIFEQSGFFSGCRLSFWLQTSSLTTLYFVFSRRMITAATWCRAFLLFRHSFQ